MHFYCECGECISDVTDHIPNKAHIIADQDWFDLFSKINSEFDIIVNKHDQIEEIIDKIIDLLWHTSKDIYQCEACGRLYIEDGEGHFHIYEPVSHIVSKKVLRSIKGEKWQGFLYGDWEDVKPVWRSAHGYIWIECNVEDEPISREYDSFEVFQKAYYELFDKLKKENILQSSQLKRNNKELHYWNIEQDKEKSK